MRMARICTQKLQYLHKCQIVCNKLLQVIQNIFGYNKTHTRRKDDECEDSFRRYYRLHSRQEKRLTKPDIMLLLLLLLFMMMMMKIFFASHFFFLFFFWTVRAYRYRLHIKKEVIFGSREKNDKKEERETATTRIVHVFGNLKFVYKYLYACLCHQYFYVSEDRIRCF